MKPANPRTGGAGIMNGKLALLCLVVVLSIETCTGQRTRTPEQNAATICNGCISNDDCLRRHISNSEAGLAQGSDSGASKEQLAQERILLAFLKDCCNTATGELDKCSADQKKKIAAGNGGDLLAPKACLVLLSLGTLMMAWLY